MVSKNVTDGGFAFSMSLFAGLWMSLGALLVFSSKMLNVAAFAISLGLAGGVMLYVCLMVLFQETHYQFNEASNNSRLAYFASTVSFFTGIIILHFLHLLIDYISVKLNAHHYFHLLEHITPEMVTDVQHNLLYEEIKRVDEDSALVGSMAIMEEAEVIEEYGALAGQKDDLQKSSSFIVHPKPRTLSSSRAAAAVAAATLNIPPPTQPRTTPGSTNSTGSYALTNPARSFTTDDSFQDGDEPESVQLGEVYGPDGTRTKNKQTSFWRIILVTGLAVFARNLPEGMATFLCMKTDYGVGAAVTLAIGLHNIPKGLCAAVPLYKATGSKWKGLIWGILSGLAQPLGGLVIWGALSYQSPGSYPYATALGLVAGMMIYIILRDILPYAYSMDPQDHYVTWSMIGGLGVMAACLLFFTDGNISSGFDP